MCRFELEITEQQIGYINIVYFLSVLIKPVTVKLLDACKPAIRLVFFNRLNEKNK